MEEVLLRPKEEETGTGGEEGIEKVVMPSSLTTDQRLTIYLDVINKSVKRIEKLNQSLALQRSEVNELKEDIKKQTFRSVETLGIFASILALLIIDVSIIKSVDKFLSAILLISGLTFSISIFLILIHILFSTEKKTKLWKRWFWLPFLGLGGLIILGVVAYFKHWF